MMKRNGKGLSRAIPVLTATALLCAALPLSARADGTRVVTLGDNLTNEQKLSMYEYFSTTVDEVETITVTNADERKYMEGIASEAEIGTKTYSCSYVEPTSDGGIQVKVANLTFVTSSMIASTLTTSGVENCNVVAASPMEVSGTGALTGIMMAYETASGETLDEEQKATATEELVTTGELADSIGDDEATSLMNDVKEQVVEDGLTDESQISDLVTEAADDQGVTLTDDQVSQISSLMAQIGQYDIDADSLKQTLDNLNGEDEGFFSRIVSKITGIFKGDDSEDSILTGTNDSLLGDDAIIDSTLDAAASAVDTQDSDDSDDGLLDKIIQFFRNLFGQTSDDTDESTHDVKLTTPEDKETTDESTTDDTTDATGDGTTDSTGEDTTDGTTDTASEDATENTTEDATEDATGGTATE